MFFSKRVEGLSKAEYFSEYLNEIRNSLLIEPYRENNRLVTAGHLDRCFVDGWRRSNGPIEAAMTFGLFYWCSLIEKGAVAIQLEKLDQGGHSNDIRAEEFFVESKRIQSNVFCKLESCRQYGGLDRAVYENNRNITRGLLDQREKLWGK